MAAANHDTICHLAELGSDEKGQGISPIARKPEFCCLKSRAGALPDHCSLIVFAIGRGGTGCHGRDLVDVRFAETSECL